MARALLACAFVAVTSPARADDVDRARILFQAGRVQYEQGDYRRALDSFEQSYKLAPRPALLYNAAQAADRLGDLPHTIELLDRYLRTPDVPDRGTVEAWKRSLERQRAQPPTAPALAPLVAAPQPAAAPDAAVRASPPPVPRRPSRWPLWTGAALVVVAAGLDLALASDGNDSGVDYVPIPLYATGAGLAIWGVLR